MPCNREQADERFLLHEFDASKSFDWILIKTVDTDIVIITKISLYQRIMDWVRQRKIHEMYSNLWDCIALRAADFNWTDFFYPLIGCGTASSISGKAKISFWDKWKWLPEVTQIFAKLSNITAPVEITEATQLNGAGEGLMNTISRFRAIYHMQQSLAGNCMIQVFTVRYFWVNDLLKNTWEIAHF